MGSRDDSLSALVVFWVPSVGLGVLTRAMAIARHLTVPYLIYTMYPDFARRETPHVRRVCLGALEDVAKMQAVVVTDTGALPYARAVFENKVGTRQVLVERRCSHEYDAGVFDRVIDPNDRYIVIRQREEWLPLEKAQKIVGDDYPVVTFHAGKDIAERNYVWAEAARVAERLDKRLKKYDPTRYFPVCELLPAAGHVVCAPGYNSFAETKLWGGETTYVPMGRDHDDQADRLQEIPTYFDGAFKAAEVIRAQSEIAKKHQRRD